MVSDARVRDDSDLRRISIDVRVDRHLERCLRGPQTFGVSRCHKADNDDITAEVMHFEVSIAAGSEERRGETR